MTAYGQAAPEFVQLSAHPLRWRLLTELAVGDRRVRELVDSVGERQSLISYHLRLLRDGGLVTARRSSFDGRDSYYHLDLDRCAGLLTATGPALHPALQLTPSPPPVLARTVSVLFSCTGNSGRSPIAEALLRQATDHVDVTSAGSNPKPQVHPHAVRLLRDDFGIDIGDQRPRHLDALADHRFDFVVTLCDKVREVCPDFPGHPRHLHWSMPDPAGEGTYAAYRRTAADIQTRVRHLIPVLAKEATS
ncbi:ArsR family transcriptional regulator [Fodinicola acaciae]|uniref:arsenate reductase/protein-tyrosine-phosphatase family protein n=1 Tax=Fodinicola acaciae TaxID=2681555 RepID=UPI0013D46067|nr:ArsR family transcriptional regulator [Fodinicola acaciae]